MLPAPIPANEAERLASLRRMLLLSTPDEAAFDRVTRTAQRLFDTPIALLSLIDADRQWFKSCIGLPVRETGRDVSFCGHAILDDGLFVIENALADPRFADNPLVTGAPRVIFYAGRPLKNAEGHRIGTLCVIDHQPRRFSPADRQALDDLGCWMEALFLNRDLGDAERTLLAELDEARRDSLLDPMLNIWHPQAIQQLLERECLRAMRHNLPLAVATVRLENLPAIAAAHGEAVADHCLSDFARRVRTTIRSMDLLGRWEKDVLLLILPETDAAAARRLTERIAAAATLAPYAVADQLIEAELGIGLAAADFAHSTPSVPELIDAAREDAKHAR